MLLRCETADELAQRKLLLRRAARAVVAAAAIAAASVATWFVAIWVIGALGGPGPDVQAATGLLAVAVLVAVMNWFFHKVYWTGWIAAHNLRRRRLQGMPGGQRRLLLGPALLVVGSYVVAEEPRVRRPRRRAELAATA